MSIQSVGLRAYTNALGNFKKAEQLVSHQPQPVAKEFTEVLKESLVKVNDMQTEKNNMIMSFASGENTNVHELMITMQKASLAMEMTSAVRNKAIEAYKELTRLQF